MFAVVFYQQLNICCILVPNCEDCEVMVFGPWSLVCGLWSSVFGLRSNVDIVSNIDRYIYIYHIDISEFLNCVFATL